MSRRSKRPRKPVLEPGWTQAEAAELIAIHLAPGDSSQIAFRVAALTFARTPDELIHGAAQFDDEGISTAKTMSDILKEGAERLKARQALPEAAERRVLWAACVVIG